MKQIRVRIPEDVHTCIKVYCAINNISMDTFMNNTIDGVMEMIRKDCSHSSTTPPKVATQCKAISPRVEENICEQCEQCLRVTLEEVRDTCTYYTYISTITTITILSTILYYYPHQQPHNPLA